MINFDKKKHVPAAGNNRTYIAIHGDLREDIKALAAWSGKTIQQTGFELLEQAVAEVIHKVPKDQRVLERNRGTLRGKKR